jgi:hypothetical protein
MPCGIANGKSQIANLKSAIFNLHFTICNSEAGEDEAV